MDSIAPLMPRRLIIEAATLLAIHEIAVKSRDRTAKVAKARQLAYLALKLVYRFSTPRIGKIFERDHTAVMHGLRVIQLVLRDDIDLRERFNAVLARFGARAWEPEAHAIDLVFDAIQRKTDRQKAALPPRREPRLPAPAVWCQSHGAAS